jgi:hypothetical protein
LVSGVQGSPDVAFVGTGRAIVVWAATDGAVHALARELAAPRSRSPTRTRGRRTPA